MNGQKELTIGVSTLVDLEGLFTSKGRVVLDGRGGELRSGTGKAYGDNGEALPLRGGQRVGSGTYLDRRDRAEEGRFSFYEG